MKIEGTNKDGEKIAQEIAGLTKMDEQAIKTKMDEQAIKSIFHSVGTDFCKNSGCHNLRAGGSSRCKECSDKYKNK